MYTLILILALYGENMQIHDFYTKELCIEAAESIKKEVLKVNKQARIIYSCTRKGN